VTWRKIDASTIRPGKQGYDKSLSPEYDEIHIEIEGKGHQDGGETGSEL
jgi:hypothetical protein